MAAILHNIVYLYSVILRFPVYIFIIFPYWLLAQTKQNHFGFGLKIISGYHFAANKQSVYKNVYDANGNIIGKSVTSVNGPSLNGIPVGIDFTLTNQKNNNSLLNNKFGNPVRGITYSMVVINNPDTFGLNHAVVPFTEIRLKQNKQYNISAHVGYGLSYVTQKFNYTTNFDNRAIATHLNFALNFGLSVNYKTKKGHQLNGIIKLHHVSNGSNKMPNGGLNIILAGVGYSITEADYFTNAKPNNLQIDTNNVYFMVHLAGSKREQGYFNSTKSFYIAAVSNHLLIRLNKLYSLGAGLDFFYDASPYLSKHGGLTLFEVEEKNKYYGAIGFSNMFSLSKFFIPVGLYTYLNNVKNMSNRNYLRFGLGFMLTPKIYTGCFFKGSLKQGGKLESDFMEYSLGIKLN